MKEYFEMSRTEIKKFVNKHFGFVATIVMIEELLLFGFIFGII